MLKRVVELVFATILAFGLIACGGGQTDLSYSGATADTSPSSPSPAPQSPGGGGSTPGATGTASLTWTPPTTYEDGSAMTVAGHNVYMDSGNGFVKVGTISNPSVADFVVQNLAPGTYTFAVTAFDANGMESAFSNQASITI